MPSTTTTDSRNTSTANSSTTPWAPQAAGLEKAFTDALGAYGKASQTQAPTDFTASFSPEQLQAFRAMVGYGSNNALPNGQASAATGLTSAGTSGITGALSGFAGYNPAATNNTDSLIASAKQYAAGQDIDAQVNSAMRTAKDTARDITLPGIEQRAAGGGNTNSSRTGVAQGIVERGLAQQAADMKGSLSSAAFQNGLTLAQQQAQNNNTATLAALGGQGALGSSAASAGQSFGNSSVDNMLKQLTAAATGGAGLTDAQQATLTNQLKQYQSGVQSPYGALSGLIGLLQGNYGSTTTANTTGTGRSTQETQASPLSIAGGLIGAGTSLFGSGGFNILGSLGQRMMGR